MTELAAAAPVAPVAPVTHVSEKKVAPVRQELTLSISHFSSLYLAKPDAF